MEKREKSIEGSKLWPLNYKGDLFVYCFLVWPGVWGSDTAVAL